MLRVVYSKHCNNYKRRAKSSSEKFKEEFIMRKKLLALLMCATMVLGSSAVAFASPSTDDYDNAAKIFKKGEKVITEIDSTKNVTSPVYVPGEGGVTYGFLAKDKDNNVPTGAAVRLNSANKPLKYIGEVSDDNTGKGASVVNASVLTSTVAADAKTVYGTDAKLAGKTASYVVNLSTVANAPVYKVAVVTFGENDTTAAIANSTTEYYSIKDALTIDETTGKLEKAANYKTADGYSYDESDADLFKADLRASSTNGNYVYNFSKASGTDYQKLSVAKALEDKVLTKNAAAVKLDVYQYGVSNKVPFIKAVKTPESAVTLTISTDELSQTSIKNATSVYRISDTVATDVEAGKYNLVANVASDIDVSTPYGKFDVSLNFVDGQAILIFDQGAEASNNDGVADTTTTAAAAANNSASPKTGDVAPIAALAVVMMGACGAMVVASKKRA